MKINLTSDEAEVLLAGLRFRYYQERTDRGPIVAMARKIEEAGIKAYGWSPGVWERTLTPPVTVKVTIKEK